MAEGQSGIEKRLCAWEAHNGVEIDPNAFGFILEPLHLNLSDTVESLVAALDVYVARVGQVDLTPNQEWSVPIWLVTHVDLHRTEKVQAMLRCIKSTRQEE
jgi:hypothetical protein